MDEANGWQAGGNSYTVQFRDSCGMNKTGNLGLKKKKALLELRWWIFSMECRMVSFSMGALDKVRAHTRKKQR